MTEAASQSAWRFCPAAHRSPAATGGGRAAPLPPARHRRTFRSAPLWPPPPRGRGPAPAPPQTPHQEPRGGSCPSAATADPHLHVHVAVDGDEVALVLHPPLQLHHHRLPRQPVQEGLGVEGQALPGRAPGQRRRPPACPPPPAPPRPAASGPLTAAGPVTATAAAAPAARVTPPPPAPFPHHGGAARGTQAQAGTPRARRGQRENGRQRRSGFHFRGRRSHL